MANFISYNPRAVIPMRESRTIPIRPQRDSPEPQPIPKQRMRTRQSCGNYLLIETAMVRSIDQKLAKHFEEKRRARKLAKLMRRGVRK